MKRREELQTVKSGVIPLTVDFTADKDTINPSESVQFTSNISGGYINVPQTYDWLFPGAIPAESTDTNPSVVYQSSGNYNVSLIVNRGGQIDTLTKTSFIYVNHGVGISEVSGNQITVSPNPSNGTFKLTFDATKSQIADISIMNTAGLTVYSESNVTLSRDVAKTIVTNGLPSGEYFLYIKTNDSKLVKKILIN